jgi:centromere-localized protein 2
MTSSLPTESQLLSSFLLPPTPLALYLSLTDFRALFPSKHRNDATVELLYRELQHQVAVGADEVKRNIATEAEQGKKIMGRVRRVRAKREQQVGMDGNDDLLMIGGIEEERGGWMDVVLENEVRFDAVQLESYELC